MENWIIDFMSHYGYLAVFLLVAFENLFPPIPSEIILTFAGFMIVSTDLNFVGVVLSATAGAVIGALILYGLGALLKKETIETILDGKIGKYLGFKREDVNKAIVWFNKHGAITVLFTRCIPVVRSLISIPAGTSRMRLLPFTLYTTLGTLLWNILLVWFGVTAGENWATMAHTLEDFSSVFKYILVGLGIAVIGFFIYRKKHLSKNKS